MKLSLITKDFLELSKIRMVPMVLITTLYGYFLAGGAADLVNLVSLLVAISLVSAGSAALNNYLEKDYDARMERTKNRALPTGRMTSMTALIFGVSMVLAGVFFLLAKINLLTAFVMLLASFLYVMVYTPMKRWSWFNTFVGAIPGALPPVAGWTAATGEMGWGAVVLFLILFTWQHPHFFAIAVMHKDDYERAGFKMLSVVDVTGVKTKRQVAVYMILLFLVSLLPTALGITGKFYLVGAVLLGLYFGFSSLKFILDKNLVRARKLFFDSLIYLPGLLAVMVVDYFL